MIDIKFAWLKTMEKNVSKEISHLLFKLMSFLFFSGDLSIWFHG